MKEKSRSITLLLLYILLCSPPSCKAYFLLLEHLPQNTLHFKDWTPPVTRLLLEWSEQKFLPIQETVTNGSFSDGTFGWEATGNVQICEQKTICLTDSQISQLIAPAKTLRFEYFLQTEEDLPGFDDQAFAVTMNDSPIFSVSAEQAYSETPSWKTIFLEISQFDQKKQLLAFTVTNSGDTQKSSSVKIRNVTTSIPAINSLSKFQLLPSDDQDTVSYYQFGDQQFIANDFFSVLQQHISSLDFWSIDTYGNIEEKKQQNFYLNNQVPLLPNAEVVYAENNEIVIKLSNIFDSSLTLQVFGETLLPIRAIEKVVEENSTYVFLEQVPENTTKLYILLINASGNTSEKQEITI